MSAAPILQLADAVASMLTAATTLSQPITAARHYRPTFDLTALEDAQAAVVPASLAGEIHSRGEELASYEIQVGICRRVGTIQESRDAMMALVQEVIDLLFRRPLGIFLCVAYRVAPLFSAENLEQEHTFVSLVTFTYQAGR